MKRFVAVLTSGHWLAFSSLAIAATSDPVLVTATRTAQTADASLAAVTVITRTDIEQSQAQSVPELLTGVAGIDASVAGGHGKVTSLYMRGTNDDHVVVLVDGMRLGSATLGTYSWEFLPLDQVERIEIVRGPRSSLYGADAFGGVIQILTRKGEAGVRHGASAGYGTYDSRDYAANLTGATGGTHYSVAAARRSTDGINARRPAQEFVGGPLYSEPDTDGYTNDSSSMRVGHRFSAGTEIEAHLLHTQGHTAYDGSFVNETDFIQNVAGTQLRFAPSATWDMALRAGRSRDETDNFKDGAYVTTFNTARRQVSWQNDLTLAPKQLFTFGIDRQTDRVESSDLYNTTSRRIVGYFVQHQASFARHELLFGLRRDDTYDYGTQDTGNIAWGYAIDGERLRVVASYGTAFKAPTFNQLYNPFVGNPALRPEEAESVELGLRGKTERLRWDVRTFLTNVDNIIVFQPPTYQAVNLNRARIRGLETEVAMKTARNHIGLNATLLDPQEVETDTLLPRRAKRSVRLDATHTIGRWQFGGDWLMQSYRYDDPQNMTRISGYGLLNLRTQYAWTKDWFVRARFDNVFDKEYETAATYNSLGRRYFVTLGYQAR